MLEKNERKEGVKQTLRPRVCQGIPVHRQVVVFQGVDNVLTLWELMVEVTENPEPLLPHGFQDYIHVLGGCLGS